MNGQSGRPAGFGPPKGTPEYPLGGMADQIYDQAGGPSSFRTDDPGFQPPGDPLKLQKVDPKTVFRDLPLVTIQNSWGVPDVRGALSSHMLGIFESSAQLWDAILGDDRVTATLGSRCSGLFGREEIFKPGNDSAAAKEVLDAWVKWWPRLTSQASLVQTHVYGIGMGFSPAQLIWDTTGPVWGPYIQPWHPRYTYYHWSLRKFIALSQDGSLPIVPGDGKWLLHAPFGDYRGWVRGTIRAVAEPWLLRHFAFRDMARFSEVHGIPTRVGWTPAAADPGERSNFEQQLSKLGSETTMLIPRGVDKDLGYGYELVEARDTAWEIFPGLIDRCDMAIVLALLFQNLTTEVKGGSFAATSAHMDIRQSGIQADNAAWKHTLHSQVARPFAFLNFGDPDLAPTTEWDVSPREDYAANADQFAKFGTALELMAKAGVKFDDEPSLRKFAAERFGLRSLPRFSIGEPPAVTTAKAADKTADASHKTADASITSADAAKTKAEQPPPEPKAAPTKEAA